MIYKFLEFELDTDVQELRRAGVSCAIEPQVFDLLRHLIENRERLVSRDELFETVWQGRIVSDATLSSRVKAARKVVRDTGKKQAVIQTIPRRGFRFVALVDDRTDLTVKEPTSLSPVGDQSESLVILDKPSIAVLPFDNMTSDPEHEYFADGIAEDIITALSKIPRMHVIARNSTFAYKGQALDLHQVAGELGVRYILEGSIRCGGNRLRISAQLIDATDGGHIWAERFDRTIDDIFDIQDEITKEIVTALRVNLTDGEEARVLSRGTNDIEAWQLCTRATELLLRFNSTDYLEARALAEKALKRDPNYAYAWAILGLTFWFDGRLGYTTDSKIKFARANECAIRAMALDDTVSPAITLSVHVAGATGHEQEAVAIARRGLELFPGNADVRCMLGYALLRAGDYHEALGHFRAAMTLNPFYPNSYNNGLGRTLMVLNEFEPALVLAAETLRTQPANILAWVHKAYIYGQTGRGGEAEEAIRMLTQLVPNLRLEHVPGMLMINDATAIQRIVNGLRKVGFPEGHSSI